VCVQIVDMLLNMLGAFLASQLGVRDVVGR